MRRDPCQPLVVCRREGGRLRRQSEMREEWGRWTRTTCGCLPVSSVRPESNHCSVHAPWQLPSPELRLQMRRLVGLGSYKSTADSSLGAGSIQRISFPDLIRSGYFFDSFAVVVAALARNGLSCWLCQYMVLSPERHFSCETSSDPLAETGLLISSIVGCTLQRSRRKHTTYGFL